MTMPNININISGLSEPATKLIEKISNGVGILYEPHHIKRIAKAEAEAKKITKIAQHDLSDLEHRTILRVLNEEKRRQENMEKITASAISRIDDDAKPENMDDDWIIYFYENCRNTQNEEMQSLWASILTGEAKNPGTFSRRTLNFISTLDKSDASLFTRFCSYCWKFDKFSPLVYDMDHEIYNKNGINFNALQNLDSIGLINLDASDIIKTALQEEIEVTYFDTSIRIKFSKSKDNELNIGVANLTNIGQELAPICGSQPLPDFFEFVLSKWKNDKLTVSKQ